MGWRFDVFLLWFDGTWVEGILRDWGMGDGYVYSMDSDGDDGWIGLDSDEGRWHG